MSETLPAGTDPHFRTRLLSAFLLGPLLLALLAYSAWSLELALVALAAGGGLEAAQLLRRMGFQGGRWLGFLPAPLLLAGLHLGWQRGLTLAGVLVWTLSLLWLARPSVPRGVANGLGSHLAHLVAALYLATMPLFLCLLEAGPWGGLALPGEGARRLLFALFTVWAADSAAYLAGRAFGRHRLWPEVSPKKTVEGTIGGIAGATVVAALLAPWMVPSLGRLAAVGLGCGAGIAAVLGDLVESRVKRLASVKDSGNLIPGHGGILDRFDSLLFAAPLFYYYLARFGR